MAEVSVAEDVLAQGAPFYEDGRVAGWSSSPAFLVSCDVVDRGAAALHAAGRRFYRVNEHGREIGEDELEVGWYTPNWVSEVHLTDVGPAILVDTKGELTRAMGETMIAILVEELTARGVRAHIAALPADLELPDETWSSPA